MKKKSEFLSENFHFFGGKIFSIYFNRHVFVMKSSTESYQRLENGTSEKVELGPEFHAELS